MDPFGAAVNVLIAMLSSWAAIAIAFSIPIVRAAFSKLFDRGIQLHFDKKLEATKLDFQKQLELNKSELRQIEEHVKAQIQERDRQMRALADTALAVRSSRHEALDARRLKAVEQIWTAKSWTDRLLPVNAFMQVLDYEKAMKAIERDTGLQQMVHQLATSFADPKIIKGAPNISIERPFVSDDLWQAYSAYSSIISLDVVKLQALEHRVTAPGVVTDEATIALVRSVLPELSSLINQHKAPILRHLLPHIEAKMLKASQAMLVGHDTDLASVAQTAELVRMAQASLDRNVPRPPEGVRSSTNLPDELKKSLVGNP